MSIHVLLEQRVNTAPPLALVQRHHGARGTRAALCNFVQLPQKVSLVGTTALKAALCNRQDLHEKRGKGGNDTKTILDLGGVKSTERAETVGYG